jgi:hypothetical protein
LSPQLYIFSTKLLPLPLLICIASFKPSLRLLHRSNHSFISSLFLPLHSTKTSYIVQTILFF